jgi:hypothetical protein
LKDAILDLDPGDSIPKDALLSQLHQFLPDLSIDDQLLFTANKNFRAILALKGVPIDSDVAGGCGMSIGAKRTGSSN